MALGGAGLWQDDQAALTAVRPGTPYKTKLVLVGDSLFNNGQDPGYTVTSTASFAQNTRGWWQWVQAMAGQPWEHNVGWNAAAGGAPYRIGHNWGKGSDTTTTILARQEEWLAVIDSSTLVMCNAITNDPTAGGDNLGTTAQFIANVAEIHALVTAKGAHLLYVGLGERNQVDGGGTAYWTTSARHKIAYQNDEALREYCRTTPNITYFDRLSGFIAAATGDAIADMTKDGLHDNQRYAYKVAQKFLGDHANLIPPPKPNHAKSLLDVYDATNNPYGNLLSNGCMVGTGGTTSGTQVSGTVADTWNVIGSSSAEMVTVASIVTDSTLDALRWQRLAITCTAPSATRTVRLQWNSGTNITTGVTSGGWYKLAFLLRFQKSSALNKPIGSFYALLEDKSASGWDTRWGQAAGTGLDAGWPEEDSEILFCETQAIQLTGTTGLDLDFYFTTPSNGALAASTQIFDITGVNVFRLREAPNYT